MSVIDIFAWIVLLVISASLIYVFVFLGLLPGKVARARNHPYAEAISIGSWLGLLVGGIGWAAILVWAYAAPRPSSGSETRSEDTEKGGNAALAPRIALLETKIAGVQPTYEELSELATRVSKLELALAPRSAEHEEPGGAT